MRFIVCILLWCTPLASAQADVFRNAYISFELPVGWKCALEVTEWVCVDEAETGKRTSIIILTAKEEGLQDRPDIYEDHLSVSRPLMNGQGQPTGRSSRVEFVKRERIGDREWVYGRHYESEVPGWFTDYFAIVSDGIAMLVTFSAHRDHHSSAFERFYPSMVTIKPEDPYRKR